MVLNTILSAFVEILHLLIEVYIWIIIAATLISWVRPDPTNPLIHVLNRLTEPLFARIRRYFPVVIGGLDLTPILVIIVLKFIDLSLVNILSNLVGEIKI